MTTEEILIFPPGTLAVGKLQAALNRFADSANQHPELSGAEHIGETGVMNPRTFVVLQKVLPFAELPMLSEAMGMGPEALTQQAEAVAEQLNAAADNKNLPPSSAVIRASLNMLNAETDQRFWAQTNYKIKRKLDMSNPRDKAMVRVWLDVYKKVNDENEAGKLATTYDHPEVNQRLDDATVAQEAGAASLDAAKADPENAPQHVAAAKTGFELAAELVRKAADMQPPSVSEDSRHEAAHEVASMPPPPPHAPSHEHVAHEQAKAPLRTRRGKIAHRLLRETDARFHAQTGYRPGRRPDPLNPTDQKMLPIWRDIHRKVKHEHARGRFVASHEDPHIAKNLEDAAVAHRAAVMHMDAAAKDPWAVESNVAAAKAATALAAQKTQEAASAQPPTASPELIREAAHSVASADPPPSDVPAEEHLAHEQAKKAKTVVTSDKAIGITAIAAAVVVIGGAFYYASQRSKR